MPTKWFHPSSVTQYGQVPQHLSWLGTDVDFTTIKQVRTVKDLTTISNDLQLNNLRTTTYYLLLKEFNIKSWDVPDPLNGIELYINMQRGGRITDETVVFSYQGNNVSDNRASADLSNTKTYGGEGDTWNMPSLVYPLISQPDFAVLLRYQSHVYWPHKTTPNMEHVQLRFW
jgi:hypothetical protein